MSSLYQIYLDGLKRLQGIQPPDDPSGLSSDMSTDGAGFKALMSDRPEDGSPLTQPGGNLFPTKYVPQNQGQLTLGNTTVNLPKSVLTKKAAANQAKAIAAQNNKVPEVKTDQMPSDPIVTGGSGTQQGDISFMQKLANMANVDFAKAQATWKEKGGFEGLMANPAFTIGLAFMQAGAEGKSLGQGALDNVIKAGAISQNYKKILDARKEAPIQATAADIAETKNLLSKVGISEGNWFENFGSKIKNFFDKNKGSRNPGLDYDKAVEEISVQYQAAVRKKQAQLKEAGKPQILRIDDKIKIMEELIASGAIQKNESIFSKLGITDATIQKREHGGPVHAGKPYVVGEAGPEVIIPKSDGNVLTNDDSQIFAMLLASNPQLQKVSRQRAEKILRARFPEYFE